jgi:hypothetical protein
MKNELTKEEYDNLINAQKSGIYANKICNAKCGLGSNILFKVLDTNINVEMKCTQIGGMWTGSHCFVLSE